MLRALAALVAVAALASAQERTWKDAQAESARLRSQGKIEEAAAAMAEASQLATAADPKDRAAIEHQLSQLLSLVCRMEEAETHGRRAVELLEGAVPALDPTLAVARVMLARIKAVNGRLDEAALDACTALEAVQGEAPAIEAGCYVVLARVSFGRREYAAALELLKLAIARVREAEPEPGPLSHGVAGAVATLAMGIGRYDLADRMLAEISEMHEKARPNPADALGIARLATDFLIKQRRLAEAEGMARASLEKNAPMSGGIPIPVAELTVSLARVLLERNDLEGAAECLERAEPPLRRPGYDTRVELASLLDARAELRRRRGDRKAARTDLDEALRLHARDGEHGLGAARTLLALARLESEDGAHARAVDCAWRATRIYLREIGPTAEGRDACDAYEALRVKALEAGLKDVPALRGMRVGEELEPGAAETDAKVKQLVDRAWELASQKDFEGVLASLAEACKLRPGEPSVHSLRGTVLAMTVRSEEAVVAMDEAIGWNLKPNGRHYSARALMQLHLRHDDRVIVDATYALLLGDDDGRNRQARGLARIGRGEAELGLRNLDVCAKAKPNDPTTLYFRGTALLFLDRLDDALVAFRAVGDGVHRSSARAKVAWVERCLGNIDAALGEAARVIESDPKAYTAYGVRGFIRLDRGEWKAALADFEAWAGDEPPSLYGRILQWVCRARLGDRDAASEALRGAIDGEKEIEDLKVVARAILGEGPVPAPEGPVPADRHERGSAAPRHFLLGAWREVEGDPAGARAHYARALAMDRRSTLEHESAKAALARLGGSK